MNRTKYYLCTSNEICKYEPKFNMLSHASSLKSYTYRTSFFLLIIYDYYSDSVTIIHKNCHEKSNKHPIPVSMTSAPPSQFYPDPKLGAILI